MQYPVTCKIASYTNLQWRDYEFSGKIVKPAGVVYDSIWVGVDVYSSGGRQYRFKFRNDTMIVSGGRFSDTVVPLGNNFDNGDELYFKATALTDNREIGDTTYLDSKINLNVDIGINNPLPSNVFYQVDTTANLIKEGYSAVYFDLVGKESSAIDAIKIKNIEIKKHE